MTGNPSAVLSSVFTWTGKTASVNRWHGARAIPKGKRWIATIYENTDYKAFKMDFGSQAARHMTPVSGYTDIYIELWMWKMKDTDGAIKAVQDALEKFGVIDNDRFIRDPIISRHYHKKAEKDTVIIKFLPIPDDQLELMKKEMELGYEAYEGLDA